MPNPIVIAVIVLASIMEAAGQTAGTPASSEAESVAKEWEFSFATIGYLVPHDQSYVSPTFMADREQLHLEARYNYEAQRTGSLWVGYNLSTGHTLALEFTPMLGGVVGDTTGIAPGYEMSLKYKRVELLSDGEVVVDIRNHNSSFFYTWDELVYTPLDWFHVGLVSQRTRAYQTDLDVQRGFSAGVSYKKADFTTYVFNAGWTDPTVVLSLSVKF